MRTLLFLLCFSSAVACAGSTAGSYLCAAEVQSKTDNQTLRVVSYNIKRGLGNDGVTDLERTARVIRELKPDFVGLQEVDEKTRRCGGLDQAVELGKQLGMHHAFAPFMDYDGGRYGLAVLSRYPIANVAVVKLPEGNEPRVALAAEVTLPDGVSVTFVNLHFDWVKDDTFRYAQATALKKHLDGLTTSYILLGDFNDVPESRTLDLFRQDAVEAKKPDNDHFTFSATAPAREIDFIFAAPQTQWEIGDVAVVDERVASDHRPVVANLKLLQPR